MDIVFGEPLLAASSALLVVHRVHVLWKWADVEFLVYIWWCTVLEIGAGVIASVRRICQPVTVFKSLAHWDVSWASTSSLSMLEVPIGTSLSGGPDGDPQCE